MPKRTTFTTGYTTCHPITAEDMIRMMADFDRRWPKSERCMRLGVSPRLFIGITNLPQETVWGPFPPLSSLPFALEYGLPDGSCREYMQDGSSVLNYSSGRRVRCLPNGA